MSRDERKLSFLYWVVEGLWFLLSPLRRFLLSCCINALSHVTVASLVLDLSPESVPALCECASRSLQSHEQPQARNPTKPLGASIVRFRSLCRLSRAPAWQSHRRALLKMWKVRQCSCRCRCHACRFLCSPPFPVPLRAIT